MKEATEAVSVIVCAKNEAQNLRTFLPLILQQDYHDFEVIVVNDGSTDNTKEVLTAISKKHDQLKTIHIETNSTTRTKKQALTKGIECATNEWLLLTDADCKVNSKHWIRAMARNFSCDKSIVVGFGGYIKTTDKINDFIRYETIFIALQYLCFAASGIPYMGVGRNIAYRKSLFVQAKGFESHLDMASGDDDLFVRQTANKTNTAIEVSKDSFTFSVAEKNIKQLIEQKQRHISTSTKYKLWVKILLSAEIGSRILFYVSMFILVLGVLVKEYFKIPIFFSTIAINLVLIRTILQQCILQKTIKHFGGNNISKKIIIFDILIPLYYFYTYINVLKNKRSQYE